MNLRNDFDTNSYNPRFIMSFLLPKYWFTWVLIIVFCFLSLLPVSARHRFSQLIARIAIRVNNKANRRARVNLKMCFPEKHASERESILYQSYVTSIAYIMSFPLLSLRGKKWLKNNTIISGMDNLKSIVESEENAILLVPHTWAIDVPAILFASKGWPVSAMAKAQKNEVSDWLMHKQRVQYGGRVYDRSGGIKPFIKSIRQGYLGYYLPDEDLGAEHSVFVNFFATTKATFSGLGRLSEVSKAKIVPLFVTFDPKSGQYQIDISPALPFPTGGIHTDARMMNECIEKYVMQKPEQYMWILRLLKTRSDTDINPYH